MSLTFEGINLPNMDVGSKTDAFCALYQIDGNKKSKIGETEMIADTLNPRWIKNISVDFYFEVTQNFRVEVYDCDDIKKLNDMSKHDYIGGFDFVLSKVASSVNQELTGNLTGGAVGKGKIKIHGTEIKPDYDKTAFTFSCELKLPG